MIKYQIAVKTETCTLFARSALFAKPSNQDIATELLDDGEKELSGDWTLIEGTIEELTQKAAELNEGTLYSIKVSEAITAALSEEGL